MPNGTPKGILLSQAEVPKVALGGTPLAALGVGVAGVLNSIASIFPEMPALPAMANGLPKMGAAMPKIPVVTEFIKSIETGLPTGLPKLGNMPGADGEVKVAPAPAKAPTLVFE